MNVEASNKNRPDLILVFFGYPSCHPAMDDLSAISTYVRLELGDLLSKFFRHAFYILNFDCFLRYVAFEPVLLRIAQHSEVQDEQNRESETVSSPTSQMKSLVAFI